MGKISAIFLQDYSPQYISQCFVWSRLQRCKWCRFYCFPKGRLSSLITFTVRKFYWCSNSFFLPDFTLLLPVVNSRRQFWVVLLLPGCSGPSCTQVFLLIFHWSPSRWWTFGSWRACKFELIWSLSCEHTYVPYINVLHADMLMKPLPPDNLLIDEACCKCVCPLVRGEVTAGPAALGGEKKKKVIS